MKPDLLLRADEPYGPPNPGMSCVETPVSRKDLDIHPPPPVLVSAPLKLQGEKENTARWPPANQLNPIYDYMLLSCPPARRGGG